METPRARIRAASAAIRWYTGISESTLSSTWTGSAAKVRNLCWRVHHSKSFVFNSLQKPEPGVSPLGRLTSSQYLRLTHIARGAYA